MMTEATLIELERREDLEGPGPRLCSACDRANPAWAELVRRRFQEVS